MFDVQWPSSSKLQNLREVGQVPYSSFATSAITLLAVGSTIFLLRDRWFDFLAVSEELLTRTLGGEDLLLKDFKDLREQTWELFAMLVTSVIVAVLFFGLLQTRFLFCPGLIALDLSRLNRIKYFSLSKVMTRLATAVLSWFIFPVAVLLISWYLLPQVLALLNNDLDHLLQWPEKFAGAIAPVLVMLLVASALILLVVGRLKFLFAHRMTKQEIEQELREGD